MTELDAAIARAFGVELATERMLPSPDAEPEAFLRAAIEIGAAIGARRSARPAPAAWDPLPQRPVVSPTAPERTAAVARALAWASAGGARWNGIEVRIDERGAGSIHATRTIAAGEAILAVPKQLMVIEEDRDELAVWLALEVRDPTSPWCAFLGGAPVRFDELPVFHDAADLAALAGTAAHALAVETNHELRTSHARLPSEVRARVSLADFAWGRAVLMSRGFHVPGSVEPGVALVPVVEYFNHRRGDTTWTFDPYARDFEVVTERAFAAGEEIGFSYGERSNTRLFVQYGFTERGAPGEAGLVFERAEDPVVDVAAHLLWNLPLAAPAHVLVGGALDDRLFRALSIARLHASSAADRAQALELGFADGGDLPWLGAERELAAFARLDAAARRALAGLDSDVPRATDDAWHQSCATVRASERGVIAQILELAAAAPDVLHGRAPSSDSPLVRQYTAVVADVLRRA